MKSEAKIQSEIFTEVWNKYPQYRRLFFHIPNGGKRSVIEATRFKSMGVIAGIPDMFLAIGNVKYHGYFMEIKKPGEKLPDHQKKIHDLLRFQNYKVEVFSDTEAAIESVDRYVAML